MVLLPAVPGLDLCPVPLAPCSSPPSWRPWAQALDDAFDDSAMIGDLRNTWWSPNHQMMKPMAQLLDEASIVDLYDVKFPRSVFSSMPVSTDKKIEQTLNNPDTRKPRSIIHQTLLFGQQGASFDIHFARSLQTFSEDA